MPTREGVAAEPSYAAARRALVVGAGGFWATVAVCLLLSHSATTEHDGISYFSVRAATLPVIVLGYASVSAGMLAAARRFPDDALGRRLVVPMRAMPVCFVALLVTPFDEGTALNWTHMTFGVSLAVTQAGVAIWLCTVLPATRVVAATALMLVGGGVAALSLPDSTFNFLLQGELLFYAGFCACLVTAVGAAAATWGDRGDTASASGTLAPD